jgi:hypothetical protein
LYFEFYLDDLEIEEPQGFADIILNMKRDDNWHGIFFEASTSELAFYGAAAAYLKNKKETEGLKSDVTFKALQACGIYDELETIFEGKLDFGKYTQSCGNSCLVKIPVEQVGCLMTLRNRYDQKVDLDATTTFNKMSALQQYSKLNFQMELPAKALDVRAEGRVSLAGDTDGITVTELLSGYVHIRPVYEREIFNSINTGQIASVTSSFAINQAFGGLPPSPQILFEDNINCFSGEAEYEIRLKGRFTADGNNDFLWAKLRWLEWFPAEADDTLGPNATVIQEFDILPPTGPGGWSKPIDETYDQTFTGTIELKPGYGYYAVLEIAVLPGDFTINNTFDPETYFRVSITKVCPPTDANVYAINETLSRVTEAITDNCLKVKSDYYGRTDSQPYTSAEDGCGGLRVTASGLKIRNAPTPAFFSSLKDLFDGLRGIDNIGMGIEDNPFIPGFSWLRIEPVEYFYQDQEVLALPFVPEAEILVQEQLHYSGIKSGYHKWEVERVNGLDEPNSNREYRTGLSSVNNPIDITSKLIAGSYPIEVTRQQSFAATGAADTTYDNETFIICVERQAYGFIVEQGNIDNAANVFSPQTLYNWRIRPFSNLMRWFKSIANSYPNITDSANKLFFSSGTGNFLAEGEIGGAYPTCKLENGVMAENRDLSQYDFIDQAEAKPLWKPEYATLKYPISVADYKTLKAQPYGYISFQCGTGEWKKGYVQNLRYRLNAGQCDFTLKLKWD